MPPDQSTWSAEARALFRPAHVFRTLARTQPRRGSLLRRPLALTLAFGALVSILASGRFSVRLVLDGAVSFAFVPSIQLAALAIVLRTRGARGADTRPSAPFARNVDLFFIGNAPWLVWMVGVGAVFGVVPSRSVGTWVLPALVGCAAPAIWSAWIDVHFFREVLQEPPRRAVRLLLVERAITWTAVLGVFLGIAIWGEVVPQAAAWVGL